MSKLFDKLCHKIMLSVSDKGHKVPILSITIDLEKYNVDPKYYLMTDSGAVP